MKRILIPTKCVLLVLLVFCLNVAAQTEKPPAAQAEEPDAEAVQAEEEPEAQTEKKIAPLEYRRHFRVIDREQEQLYEATLIARISEEKDENYLLIHDEGHGEFIIRKVWTFENQQSVSRMTDIKNRSFIQASYIFQLSSKTRSDTHAEARRNPLLMDVPAILTLETNGGRWEGLDRDWNDAARLRQLRHQVRQTVDFSLLEATERMRGTLFAIDSDASFFYATVCKYVVYGTSRDETTEDDEGSSSSGMKALDIAPNCDFDKQFGFPCSAKQLERVKKAAAEQKPLPRY